MSWDDWQSEVTAVVTTSPIRSHPSMYVLRETLESVRMLAPNVPILVAADGVREEDAALKGAYGAFLASLHNVAAIYGLTVVGSRAWVHQAVLTELALRHVATPHVWFLEHDTPMIERDIDFAGIVRALETDLDLVRFHHEAAIPAEHEYLMLDREPWQFGSIEARRTAQWSQRPHIARTAFYWDLLRSNFSRQARTMIEDCIYGVVERAHRDLGIDAAWTKYRLAIYQPKEGSLRCSYHSDGRDGAPKYDDRMTF